MCVVFGDVSDFASRFKLCGIVAVESLRSRTMKAMKKTMKKAMKAMKTRKVKVITRVKVRYVLRHHNGWLKTPQSGAPPGRSGDPQEGFRVVLQNKFNLRDTFEVYLLSGAPIELCVKLQDQFPDGKRFTLGTPNTSGGAGPGGAGGTASNVPDKVLYPQEFMSQGLVAVGHKYACDGYRYSFMVLDVSRQK